MSLQVRVHGVPRLIRDRRWWLLLLACWALGTGLSLKMHIDDIREQSVRVASEGARNMFRMVVLTRKWNASHGGVYVPVTARTQPNTYLQHPRRDLTSSDGQPLTLINPAYMTRLISEMAEKDGGVIFRLSSLKPIRPENAPDDWERKSLQSFEAGGKESLGVENGQRGPMLRYMAPLMVEPACLKCHESQGYKVGDVRGGVSISQRLEPIIVASRDSVRQETLTHGGVFLLVGLMGWGLLELLRRRWLELSDKIREVEAARSELVQSEKMASLGRMVAGFAHEINTPVGVAVSAVSHSEECLNRIESMLDHEEVSEQALRAEIGDLRQGGVLAMANLRRAANLVRSFKRTSIDQTAEEVRHYQMKELIEDVLLALHSKLKHLPIRVEVDCPAALLLHGAPGMVEQVLTNLVMNAIQHGFDGGTRPGRIAIAVAQQNNEVQLQFTDDGVGMQPDQLARIFEPFFTTRRGEGGSGLGLYLCYSIVTEQIGGSIQCASSPGGGCRFDIHFPLDHAANKEAKSS